MRKNQNHAGLNKIFAKYKKLRNEGEKLLEKEYLAKQEYDNSRRISKNKADECEKVIQAIKLLYDLSDEERARLLDSPSNILVSCEVASNPLFLNRIDEEVPLGDGNKVMLSPRVIDSLQCVKIYYVGDLVQKTSSYLYDECERFGRAHKGTVADVKKMLKSVDLHLGIKITDWVQPTEPKAPDETSEQIIERQKRYFSCI